MRTSVLAFSAIVLAAGSAYAALSPLTTFGAGNAFPVLNDGWRSPGEVITGDTAGTATAGVYNYLGTASLERGLAYNPATGNLILVSRSGAGNGIRILDGQTGADKGALNQGSGIITGGTFVTNMAGAGDDGAIYVGNLSTSAAANFKVYRWGSETDAAPTVAYNALSGLARTGDSFDAFGSGANTKLAASGSNVVTTGNFAAFSTADGTTYASTAYTSIAGTTATSNDYRLALTFVDSDTLIGAQGGPARVTDFAATATVTGSIPLGAAQRGMDYAVIGGIPLLAVIDSNSGLLQIFNITDPAAPVLFDQGNNTFAPTGNANGTGQVRWGTINGSSATLYAMSTNQGIQAFSFAIPEPSCLSLLGLGAAGLLRRRRA